MDDFGQSQSYRSWSRWCLSLPNCFFWNVCVCGAFLVYAFLLSRLPFPHSLVGDGDPEAAATASPKLSDGTLFFTPLASIFIHLSITWTCHPSCLIMSCLVMSCHVMSYHVMSYVALLLSCLALSYLILFILTFVFAFAFVFPWSYLRLV